MFNKIKYILIILTVVLQIGTIIAIFYETSLAMKIAVVYAVSIISLIGIFIYERRLEKKEEINYDDFDY
ncbi:hypothetical protein [Piscibacillus sp. B03]|uniref:hypothetical protein n=1 Tax=Piscibacillus sp. B03 TaxID=3457430 RepID=UPI003FCE8B27